MPHLSRPGSDRGLRPQEWCGTPEENYCPRIQEVCWWKGVIFSFVAVCTATSLPMSISRPLLLARSPGTDLARVTTGEVQHVEEEAQLTCQAELFLAQVALD